MIFYGAPGMGKTTLAIVLANEVDLPYRIFNAVNGTKKELDTLFAEAKMFPGFVLIVDEVHRLNKDKQDLLLPHVENGSITLIGATTANPLHCINPAIRSRCHLFEVRTLSDEDIATAIRRALKSPKGYDGRVTDVYKRQSFVRIPHRLNLCDSFHIYRLPIDHLVSLSLILCSNSY